MGVVPHRVHVTAPLPPLAAAALADGFELLPEPGGAEGIVATLGLRVDDASPTSRSGSTTSTWLRPGSEASS